MFKTTKNSIKKRRVVGGFVVLLVLILDQITKGLVLRYVKSGSFVPVCDFFNIVCVLNKGISFGIFKQGENWQLIMVGFVICFISIVLVVKYWNSPDLFESFFYSLIIGGAFGNIIDRILHGAVVDFLDFHISSLKISALKMDLRDIHWPAFNVADSCIVIGVIFLFFSILKGSSQKKSKSKTLKTT